MKKASCLCGKVKFTLTGRPINFNLCHCNMCQKFHGAAFGPYVWYKEENFKISSGKKFEKIFKSSKWASRTFCSNCGSSLRYIYHKDPSIIFICAGVLDGKINVKPKKHIFVKDKCSWYKIQDNLPKLKRF